MTNPEIGQRTAENGKRKTSNTIAFCLVATLFLCWGVANNMNDTLIAAFKRIMSMTDLQSSLVQFSFYGAYFCVSLPAAYFISRYSYKAGILLGLALYAAGTMLFYPAGEVGSYLFFLIAIYVMAAGCAVLETTANPYILSMGSRESATRRLNLAQTLNPPGAIIGILISRHFILSELQDADATARADMSGAALAAIQNRELTAISSTYLIIGCVLLVLLAIMVFALPSREAHRSKQASGITGKTLKRLWDNRIYRYGVAAQFFYVGAQTCVWSFTIRLTMSELGMLEKDASMIFLYSILDFTFFRFFLTWLMKYVRPLKLLWCASALAIVLTLMVVLLHGWMAIIALIGISGCMSLMFPTIYGTALEDVGMEDAKPAASGLIMAILGGALITPLQALLSDAYGISNSFLIPLICFAVILIYSGYAKGDDGC